MTEPNSPNTDSAHTSRAVQIGWGMLICATLYVCYFSHLGAIGFVGPDEPRYAWIARAMMESGDWVTPRLYGRPWFEKPPLLYWSTGLCFKWFGVSEAAARFPSALSALFATLALAWLALRLYGAETARWLLLLLPTTVGMIGFSHAAATDMPFSGMLTIAMVCAAVILGLVRSENTPILPQTPWLALILFGFFLGLAVLAKGPAAIALCGGAVLFWALFTKRWRDAFRLFHPFAIVSFCVTALPWYILCGRRNPDFFRVFLIEHNFKRYVTPEFQHIQPFWFYGPILLIGLLPWTVTIASAFAHGARSLKKDRWAVSPGLFFVCYAIWTIAFFSLSESKLPGYVLPAVPFVVLISTRSISLRLVSLTPTLCWIAMGSAVTLIVLGLLAILQIERTPFVSTSLALIAGGFVALFLAGAQRVSSAYVVNLVAVIAATYAALVADSRSRLDSAVSSRRAFQTAEISSKGYPPEKAFTYRIQRSFQYGLNFYFHRELQEWSPNVARPVWVFTSIREADGLRQIGLECLYSTPASAVIVCEDPGSAAGRSDRGEPQKKE